MSHAIKPESWVYVIIQNPGSNEHILGQQESRHGIMFIPAFTDKEAATQGLLDIAREKGSRYEIQAIIFEDLGKYARENGFLIFILDEQGRVKHKIAPVQD